MTTSTQAQQPLLVIRPGRMSIRRYVRDLIEHRDLIRVLARRDLTLRYRQTALGVTWVVLQPLLGAGILAFVFGRIARLPTDGVPSLVFTYAGMLAWLNISGTITRSTNSFLGNTALVSKVFFPRIILPLSTLLTAALDFMVGMGVLLVMLVVSGLVPGLPFLLLPVWLSLGMMLATGLGLFLATLSVHYRDVPHITPVLIQMVLYASPVAYSVSAVPERWLTLYYLNPVAALITAFRWSVAQTPFPPAWAVIYAATVCVVIFGLGMVTVSRSEQRFGDVI